MPPYERVAARQRRVLLLMERHDVPLIAFKQSLRGGAVTDPPGEAGTRQPARGPAEKGAGTRDALRVRGDRRIGRRHDRDRRDSRASAVSGSFLARDQALMIELLADMLQRPKLEAGEFEALRARHIEFIRAAKDSDLAVADADLRRRRAVRRSSLRPHRSTAARRVSRRSRTRTYSAYYQEQVGADRLILAVAGDFSTVAAEAAARSRASPAGARRERAAAECATAPATVAGRRVLLVDAPDSVQSYFWAGNVGVARKRSATRLARCANTLFGGRFTSMLNSELRIRTGLSYGASSRFDRHAQPGHWQMSSFTQTETTIAGASTSRSRRWTSCMTAGLDADAARVRQELRAGSVSARPRDLGAVGIPARACSSSTVSIAATSTVMQARSTAVTLDEAKQSHRRGLSDERQRDAGGDRQGGCASATACASTDRSRK